MANVVLLKMVGGDELIAKEDCQYEEGGRRFVRVRKVVGIPTPHGMANMIVPWLAGACTFRELDLRGGEAYSRAVLICTEPDTDLLTAYLQETSGILMPN